ncbi:hypothetical protein GCM10010519_34040 [Streptomyces lactacystinicus]
MVGFQVVAERLRDQGGYFRGEFVRQFGAAQQLLDDPHGEIPFRPRTGRLEDQCSFFCRQRREIVQKLGLTTSQGSADEDHPTVPAGQSLEQVQ